MTDLFIDFETRSVVDVKKVGVYNYSKHPTTDIMCYFVRVPEHGIRYGQLGGTLPDWLRDYFEDTSVTVHAHNAAFERLIIRNCAAVKYGWPVLGRRRFKDTAARVARMSLPRALDKVGDALDLTTKKDKEGAAIMRRLTKPLEYTEDGPVYDEDPEKHARNLIYCERDVDTEIAVENATYDLPEREERYYQLTERINDRGVQVDVDLVARLMWRAEDATGELNAELREITNGAVTALTQVKRLKEWVEAETGLVIDSMRKDRIDETLQSVAGIPDHVRRAIDIRREGAKSSVAKLSAILDRVSEDGRVRGAFVYHGASTGRYTSQGVQLQNLVRDTPEDWKYFIDNLHKLSMAEIATMLRGCFIPAPGYVYGDADFNAIEARGVGWLAGASKLLNIYRRNGDPYCEMGTAIYNFPVDKKDHPWERFVGKQTVLGCGYGMGPPRFLAQCASFGQPVTQDVAEKAVQTYREEFPEIKQLWYDMGDAAIYAVDHPGVVSKIPNGLISFLCKDGYLRMKLPNGRVLFYKEPRVDMVEKFGRDMPELSFMGEDQTTRKWVRERTWGGKLTENAVQAFCRDLIMEAMDRIEARGIAVVLQVHDQLTCEIPKATAEKDVLVLQEEMERVPEWARGFPIKAEPEIKERFGK